MERHWNLDVIYPSKADFEKDLKKAADGLKELKNLLQYGCNADLAKIVSLMNEMNDTLETLYAYTSAKVTVNTSDKESVNALNRVEELGMDSAVVTTLFSGFVASNPEKVKAFVSENPDYSYIMKEICDDASHMMSKELEELAADLMRSGSDAFSRLQESVSSSACAELDLSDLGPELSKIGGTKTVIELRALSTHSNREVRRRAYEAELKVWKEHETAFAFALNSIKGTSLSLEKRRHWDSPIQRSCSTARITEKTLDALISSLEKYLPMFRKYLKAKAKILGVEKLAWFDIVAPVGKSAKTYTYEEALALVSKFYGTFNQDMGKFAKNAFDNNWIDPFPTKGKTGGAYDTYIPKIKESRVFANFDGTYDGVSTFAHELGHAWHDHIVSVKPALLRSYPMTLAETASIFSEFIVFKGAVEEAEGDDKLAILEQFVQGACQVCVDILCRFYFEREIFKRRAEGELMAQDFCEIMLDCQRKTYGDGIDEKLMHPYMWAVKGHYYSTGFSFYNYPYAFGQLFGLGLYSRSLKDNDGTPFYQKYNKLLSLTGQLPAKDVAATAGIDLESSSFWEEGLEIIAAYAKELEGYAS